MKISGIYKIQSISHPERCYIGSAVDYKSRWRIHIHDLKNNKHHSGKLQNHFNKYGESDLIFIMVEPCVPELLINREQYFIDTLNPFFNICKIAGSCLGVKRSQEYCENMSRARTGIPSSKKGKPANYSEDALKRMSRKGKLSPMKGKKASDEAIRKNREGHIGLPSNRLGAHLSEQTKQKLREFNLDNNIKPPSRKGAVPWNKGLKYKRVA